jgi:hypothetical protein
MRLYSLITSFLHFFLALFSILFHLSFILTLLLWHSKSNLITFIRFLLDLKLRNLHLFSLGCSIMLLILLVHTVIMWCLRMRFIQWNIYCATVMIALIVWIEIFLRPLSIVTYWFIRFWKDTHLLQLCLNLLSLAFSCFNWLLKRLNLV